MGAGRTLTILGGLAALLVGAGLWLVLGTDAGETDGPADAAAVRDDAAESAKPSSAAKPARRRSRTDGTAALTGFVKLRAGSKPAPGRTVELLREGFDPWTAETDAQGAFALTTLPEGGPFELRVQAEGFATVRLPGIGLDRSERRDVGTLWLDQAVRLPVSVRDFADRPVQGAVVKAFVAPDYGDDFDWAKAFAQMAIAPVAIATQTTDAKGSAVFEELASGRWTLVASAPGRANSAARDLQLRGGEEPGEVILRLALGHELKGRVLDPDGRPVPGAGVAAGDPNDAWDVGASAARLRATADAEGRWSLTGLAAGNVALSAGRPGTVPAVRATVRVPSVREFDIHLQATGSIAGVVTQKETGKPVEGARVRAARWGATSHIGEATTDAEGKYRIDAFPTGSVDDLRAEKEGLAFVAEDEGAWGRNVDRRVEAGGELRYDLVLRTGSTLSGRVTCAGAPVEGAKVVVRASRPTRGLEWSRTATTAADGSWTLEHVAPASAFCEARKEGYWLKGFPEEWWTFINDRTAGPEFRVEIPDAGAAKLDLVLTKAPTVRGRVEGPDGPLPGAEVAGGGAQARTAGDGTFTLVGVRPAAQVSVHASKDGFLAKAEQVAVPEEGGVPEVVLRLDRPAIVRGRVTTPDGGALADARVGVTAKTDSRERPPWMPEDDGSRADGPVRADGTFEAEVPFAEGTFVVRAYDRLRGSAESAAIRLEPGRREYQADVAFAPANRLRGRVVAGGRGVAGAQIALVKAQANQEMVWGWSNDAATVWAVTDTSGAFEASPVESGSWDVTAVARGLVRAKRKALKVPTAEEIVFELSPELEITGTVAYEDGKPVAGVRVKVRNEHGITGDQDESEESGSVATTDSSGRFRLKGLAPGNYLLHAEAEWGSRVNVRPTTTPPVAAGSAGVKVVVAAGGRITGRVVLPGGGPGSGVFIYAYMPGDDGGEWRNATSGADGTFELTGLGAGPYTLNLQSPGGGWQPWTKADVAVGTENLVVELLPGLTIEGVLVDAAGKALAGVHLQAERIRSAEERMTVSFGGVAETTDSSGAFRLKSLGEGRYRLKTGSWMPGSKQYRLQGADDVAAGTKGLRVVATEGGRVAGRVTGPSGAGVPGVRVQLQGPGEWVRPVVTGDDGRFEITGLADSADMSLSFAASGFAYQRLKNVKVGSADLRVTLQPALPTAGRVLDTKGSPVANVRVAFSPEDGGWADIQCQTDAKGHFTVDQLGEGRWKATVWRVGDGNSWTSEELGSFAAGATDLELRLPR